MVYFGSLIGGNLLALFIHRNHSDYSAIGASGAVSGIIFANIVLFPEYIKSRSRQDMDSFLATSMTQLNANER